VLCKSDCLARPKIGGSGCKSDPIAPSPAAKPDPTPFGSDLSLASKLYPIVMSLAVKSDLPTFGTENR
jgi:hypothetical protein